MNEIKDNMPKHKNIILDNGYIYRRSKHPDAPKKPNNAYQLFIKDNRNRMIEEYKDIKKVSEIISLLAITWKSLSPELKEEYQIQALQLKKQYDIDKENYTGEKYTYIRCNKKHKHFKRSTKKPLSAYNIFLSTEIPKLKKLNPKLKHKEIFTMAIENWNIYKRNTITSSTK